MGFLLDSENQKSHLNLIYNGQQVNPDKKKKDKDEINKD